MTKSGCSFSISCIVLEEACTGAPCGNPSSVFSSYVVCAFVPLLMEGSLRMLASAGAPPMLTYWRVGSGLVIRMNCTVTCTLSTSHSRRATRRSTVATSSAICPRKAAYQCSARSSASRWRRRSSSSECTCFSSSSMRCEYCDSRRSRRLASASVYCSVYCYRVDLWSSRWNLVSICLFTLCS